MDIPADVVSAGDYERVFRERTDPGTVAYITGGGADALTQRWNRSAFDRLALMPRALVDMSNADAGTTLFGEPLHHPIIIAPTAFHKLVHPEGEIATATAASLTRTWMTVSTQASVSLEEIAAHSSSPLWFQLYLQPDRRDSLVLLRRAEEAGYKAIVLTIDAAVNGIRNQEARAGFRMPEEIEAVNLRGLRLPAAASPHAGSPVFRGMLSKAPTWADIEWLRDQTSLPILLKGILNPDDACRAIEAGVSGIIVSNHGGRTLDTLPATIDALPAVVESVAGRVPVLLDGGIRRGTDIVKAVALGASAVLLGQPVLHALGVGGMPGVAHLLTIMQTEFEVAMALVGRPRLSDIDSSLIFRRNDVT